MSTTPGSVKPRPGDGTHRAFSFRAKIRQFQVGDDVESPVLWPNRTMHVID